MNEPTPTIPPAIEYRRRLDLFKRFQQDEEFRHLEIAMCRRFPVHFVNNWCLTFDPRRAPKHFPFTTYAYQVDLLNWLTTRYRNKEHGLIEKSRDMGATWIVAAWVSWAWIFEEGFVARFGSRKEDLVDDHTLDSIFGKLRYLIYRLPKIFQGRMSQKTDSHMKLLNERNGNQIVGESMNIGFGRGGRSSIGFLDEFAHVPHSEAVWASVVENSDCLIPLSTPNGKGNQFAWLRHETPIAVKSLHWSQHPLKDKKWYEEKKKTMKPWQIGQELDLSYETSKEGKVYTRFDRKWHVAKEVIRYNQEYEQWVSWDFGYAGAMAILFGQITPEGIIQIWQCFEITAQDIDFCIPISRGQRPLAYKLLDDSSREYIDKTLAKIPAPHRSKHYGDNSGKAKTANSKRSCKDALVEAGISFTSTGRQTYAWRFVCTDELFKLHYNAKRDEWSSKFEISPDCLKFIDSLNNYVWDSENLDKDDLKPLINWASHLVTAFEYLAINRFPKRESVSFREEKIR